MLIRGAVERAKPKARPGPWLSVTFAFAAGFFTNAQAERPPAPGAAAEVQINVCEPASRIATALQLETAPGSPTEIWYFDTHALDLLADGRVLRLRIAGKRSDLTLKVANQPCAAIEPPLPSGEGKCEYDLHGDHFAGALSVSRRIDPQLAGQLRAGKVALDSVLTDTQRRFLRRPGTGALATDLKPFGPALVQAYRRAQAPFEVEAWTLPRGESFVEISQKARYSDAMQVRAVLERELADAKLEQCAHQGSRAAEKMRLLERAARAP